jgi:hypothetical protein
MRHKVVFTIEKAQGCCPAVQEVVKMHACDGTPLQNGRWGPPLRADRCVCGGAGSGCAGVYGGESGVGGSLP